ncbi:hypothetical protein [Lactococcus cremoris]|uniref:hypothetical protein n=1 Tax=Lactococcus lactis subsp. cremoris TaxID=1359 RepID=UPI00300E5C68
MTQETAKELLRKTKVIRDNFYPEPIEPEHEDEQKITFEFLSEVINYLENDTDKLSVEKLQEELESCIQTLITISILANGDENIVIGNFVDSKLSKFAKTHENVTKYIEKETGKNIDVVLAENAALEAEEEEND